MIFLIGKVDTLKVESTLHVGEGYLAVTAFLLLGVHQFTHRGDRLDAAGEGGNHGEDHGHAGYQHGEILLIEGDVAHLGDLTAEEHHHGEHQADELEALEHHPVGGAEQALGDIQPQTAVGDTVEHKTFGVGNILNVQPMGNDLLLTIAFDKVGTKKIMATFAKLEKI